MAKTVRITTDNRIKILDMPWDFDSQEAAIGAHCTEIVSTKIMKDLFKDQIVMIVDESGIDRKRTINPVASYLYGAQIHGLFIHGDVLFARQSGPDTNPLENAELVKFFLKDRFPILKDE